jgi:hypothetical protein
MEKPMDEPPEGVIKGENVPREEKKREEEREEKVRTVKSVLKARGAPYSMMNDETLREVAERYVKYGVGV